MDKARPRERKPVPDGYHLVFRAWKRTKDGQILYARNYGLRAWPILVKDGQPEPE